MNTEKLEVIKKVAKRLHSIGAKKVELLNISCKTDEFNYMILASATSTEATKLLAREITEFIEKQNIKILKTDGLIKGEWIIFDCGEFCLHIQTDASRAKFHLDKLWKTTKNHIKFL